LLKKSYKIENQQVDLLLTTSHSDGEKALKRSSEVACIVHNKPVLIGQRRT